MAPQFDNDNAEDPFDLAAAEQRQAARSGTSRPKVVQPTPQALPTRSGPSSILVSPKQKGNNVLDNIHGVPWEWSDILADFVLGTTTCALFLSLKYHRLHPEYIYGRIRGLQGKYNLRLVLVLVDIPNHEDPLRELSKTSLINNVTLILCWSAAEAGRYLALYKTYEHAQPSSIKVRQSTVFADQMVDFITTPRSINKTDAVGLVSNFGSIRTAMNARPEEVGLIAGWGEKKVQRWCNTVREPFRLKKAQRIMGKNGLGISRENTLGDEAQGSITPIGINIRRPPGTDFRPPGMSRDNSRSNPVMPQIRETRPVIDRVEEESHADDIREPVHTQEQNGSGQPTKEQADEQLSEGIQAALARLRQNG